MRDMEDGDRQRIVNPYDDRPGILTRVVSLLAVAMFIGVGVTMTATVLLGNPLAVWAKVKEVLIVHGALSRGHDFSKVYVELGGSLPYPVEIKPEVTKNLLVLEQSPCDRVAIFGAQSGAWVAGERRWAAEALRNFGNRCPDGRGELNLAADHYLEIGSAKLAETIIVPLTERYGSNDLFWFTRGRVETALGKATEGIASFKNSIRYTIDKDSIGDWVFGDLASLYATQGITCDPNDLKRSVNDIDHNVCERTNGRNGQTPTSISSENGSDDFDKLVSGSGASSAQAVVADPPSVTPAPDISPKEPYAAMLWEVQSMKIPNGPEWCEAHMRGQNKDGGGPYTVHMLVSGNKPTLIIDGFMGKAPVAEKASFAIDKELPFMTVPLKSASKDMIWIEMDSLVEFQNNFIPRLESNIAHTMTIQVGDRKYLTLVQGFKIVSERMGDCNANLTKKKTSLENPALTYKKEGAFDPTFGMPAEVQMYFKRTISDACELPKHQNITPGFAKDISGKIGYVLDYSHYSCDNDRSYCGSGGCLMQVFSKTSTGDLENIFDDNVQEYEFRNIGSKLIIRYAVHGGGCGKRSALAPCYHSIVLGDRSKHYGLAK